MAEPDREDPFGPDIKIVPHKLEDRDFFVIRVESSTYLRLHCAACRDNVPMNDIAERAIGEYLWHEYEL